MILTHAALVHCRQSCDLAHRETVVQRFEHPVHSSRSCISSVFVLLFTVGNHGGSIACFEPLGPITCTLFWLREVFSGGVATWEGIGKGSLAERGAEGSLMPTGKEKRLDQRLTVCSGLLKPCGTHGVFVYIV